MDFKDGRILEVFVRKVLGFFKALTTLMDYGSRFDG
jgi:hypothetical protein